MKLAVQLEDLWEGEWLRLGHPLGVEADDAAAAIALVDRASVGLRAGVTYRFHVTGPGVDAVTVPVDMPDFPTTIAAA